METTAILAVLSLIANFLMGMVMFFMKYTAEGLKERLNNHETDIKNIKDTFIKKEDFLEFKKELFINLNSMKQDLKQDIERLRQ